LSCLFAQGTLEHPFIEKRDLKSATCLTCHPAKKAAKFVHTAVGRGCENCHQAASENNKTTVTLVAEGGDLCARCHVPNGDPVLHEPYQAGRCLVCHDPHTGSYAGQIRTQVNVLCLGCHGTGQSGVKVNPDENFVELPGRQTVSLQEYGRAPKIDAGHSESNFPHSASGPIRVKEPLKLGAETTCLSCHDPHSSQAQHLLRRAAEPQGNVKAYKSTGKSEDPQVQEFLLSNSIRKRTIVQIGALCCKTQRSAGIEIETSRKAQKLNAFQRTQRTNLSYVWQSHCGLYPARRVSKQCS
jgi:predicted CXXCH cytochrome family protein